MRWFFWRLKGALWLIAFDYLWDGETHSFSAAWDWFTAMRHSFDEGMTVREAWKLEASYAW